MISHVNVTRNVKLGGVGLLRLAGSVINRS
jgi:hypothetical protein